MTRSRCAGDRSRRPCLVRRNLGEKGLVGARGTSRPYRAGICNCRQIDRLAIAHNYYIYRGGSLNAVGPVLQKPLKVQKAPFHSNWKWFHISLVSILSLHSLSQAAAAMPS